MESLTFAPPKEEMTRLPLATCHSSVCFELGRRWQPVISKPGIRHARVTGENVRAP